MNRLATVLIALSVLAAAPALARHHDDATTTKTEMKADAKDAKAEMKADTKTDAKPMKRHARRHHTAMHNNDSYASTRSAYEPRDARHTYPGSSSNYSNRFVRGSGVEGAVVHH